MGIGLDFCMSHRVSACGLKIFQGQTCISGYVIKKIILDFILMVESILTTEHVKMERFILFLTYSLLTFALK